jgi:hypothetical protein
MLDSKPTVAIIVVNYDTAKITYQCLQSLQKIEHKEFEFKIVVVDNGSQQPLSLPKKRLNAPSYLVRTDNNIGFTGGNNLGITYAAAEFNPDYFLLLNSDTTVDPCFLQELLLAVQGTDRGIGVSKIYFEAGYEFHHNQYAEIERGRVIWFAGGTIDWPNLMAYHRGVNELDRGQFDQHTQTDFATGCSMLIKREVIEEVGLLDKRYFLYMEDVDYSMRAIRRGYKLVFCPTSVVYHKNAGSSGGSGSAIHQYYQTRNRLLFFFKYAKLRYKLTLFSYALRLLFSKDTINRRAVTDFILGRSGKQPLI